MPRLSLRVGESGASAAPREWRHLQAGLWNYWSILLIRRCKSLKYVFIHGFCVSNSASKRNLYLEWLRPALVCFSSRSMKTPAWSRRASRAELTALTQPTCQPRDSSSRWHLGYSGVLFTMQHSVQHKKLGAKERERARVWEIRYTLCLALGIHGCILSERKMCGFHLAFQGNRPKWSLRWRVGASENEWLHVAKKQTSTSNSWETCWRNFCYRSCRLQKTT